MVSFSYKGWFVDGNVQNPERTPSIFPISDKQGRRTRFLRPFDRKKTGIPRYVRPVFSHHSRRKEGDP